MNQVKICPKEYTRDYMKDHGNMIFRDREIVVEKDQNGDNVVLRFKIGDGVRPYNQLQYVSSLYSLFPEVSFFNKDYSNGITLCFDTKEENNV